MFENLGIFIVVAGIGLLLFILLHLFKLFINCCSCFSKLYSFLYSYMCYGALI